MRKRKRATKKRPFVIGLLEAPVEATVLSSSDKRELLFE